jgi:hypothetical protein
MSEDTPVRAATQLSPQERLAISRRALVRHMHRNDPPHQAGQTEHDRQVDDAGQAFGAQSREVPSGTWGLVKHAVLSWWYSHPANVAVDVAKPFISKYARANPMKLLAISAGIGAAAIFLKPWRLISVGGILLAVMKSADISGAVMSMMTRSNRQAEDAKHLKESQRP